jgi:hypothetical protein
MLRFPGIILGILVFALAGGGLAGLGSLVAGASIVKAFVAYALVGLVSAIVFVLVTQHKELG